MSAYKDVRDNKEFRWEREARRLNRQLEKQRRDNDGNVFLVSSTGAARPSKIA